MDPQITGAGEHGFKITTVILVIACLILFWHAWQWCGPGVRAMTENMCGGFDQLCPCAGNETFTVVTDDTLAKTAAGY